MRTLFSYVHFCLTMGFGLLTLTISNVDTIGPLLSLTAESEILLCTVLNSTIINPPLCIPCESCTCASMGNIWTAYILVNNTQGALLTFTREYAHELDAQEYVKSYPIGLVVPGLEDRGSVLLDPMLDLSASYLITPFFSHVVVMVGCCFSPSLRPFLIQYMILGVVWPLCWALVTIAFYKISLNQSPEPEFLVFILAMVIAVGIVHFIFYILREAKRTRSADIELGTIAPDPSPFVPVLEMNEPVPVQANPETSDDAVVPEIVITEEVVPCVSVPDPNFSDAEPFEEDDAPITVAIPRAVVVKTKRSRRRDPWK